MFYCRYVIQNYFILLLLAISIKTLLGGKKTFKKITIFLQTLVD